MKLTDIEKELNLRLEKALKELPTVLGNEAVNWIKDNFRRQGYPDRGFTMWPARAANTRRNAGRALMINNRRLSRSPRIIRTAPLRVDVGTDVPYAKPHNDGVNQVVTVKSHNRAKIGTIRMSTGTTGKFRKKRGITGTVQVKSHQRNMRLPQRQFIGPSPHLQSILRRKAIIHIGRILKG